MEEHDGKSAFDYFWENVNRLQADQHFREVLRELDEGRKETLGLLVSDPVAFLRYRGVQIPQDFRVSVKRTVEILPPRERNGSGFRNNLRLHSDLLLTVLRDLLRLRGR